LKNRDAGRKHGGVGRIALSPHTIEAHNKFILALKIVILTICHKVEKKSYLWSNL